MSCLRTRSRFDSGRTKTRFQVETMKIRFKLSGKLMTAALLVGILALPAAGRPQTGSNASLQDTLTWLTNFLPTATGAKSTDGFWNFRWTSRVAAARGCEISISIYAERPEVPNDAPETRTEEFSLSDIDAATVTAGPLYGVFQVYGSTRSGIKAVKDSGFPNGPTSTVLIGYFADQASAQRAANAFQHAAQLCTNASPF
jgi:hypothetical protein